MTALFLKVLNMSLTASYVALIVIVVRFLLKKTPKIYSYALWLAVLFRALSPISFSSSLSLLGSLNINDEYIPKDIGMMTIPQVNTSIEPIDNAINNALPAATPMASVNPMQVLIGVGTIAWVLGLSILLIYSIYSYCKINKQVQFATLIKDNIYETDQIKTPFVLGLINPKIYLPMNLQENESDYIIIHEKIHIKRLDHIIKPLYFIALSIHWFNPLIWLSYFLMIKDMEMSCDERVMRECDMDIRSSYSSILLDLSIKQNKILLPLGFGESNIKSRIKNIMNYKRPRFWIFIIGIIVGILASSLISNPRRNSPDTIAKEFLTTYYTIENTNIADMVSDESLWDKSGLNENGLGIISVIGIEEAVEAKYGEFMTEDALKRAGANRTILIGEMTAREYGSKMTIEFVHLWDEKVSDNGDITYQYSVPALVEFKDGSKEHMNLHGILVMKEIEGKWKISDFQINVTELAKVLQFGKSFLSITNHSDAPIRRVEVNTKENASGAMNADDTNMEKNTGYTFDMTQFTYNINNAESLDFTVELLDKDGEVLYEQSFTGDFSEGKDIHLYIQEDKDGKLMLNQGNSKGYPTVSITSEISNLTDEEYQDVGTAGIDNPIRDDFRKFTFRLYVEHGNEIKDRKIEVPDYYHLLKFNNIKDIYWYGGNGQRDNINENSAEYNYDIILYTRGLSNSDIKDILNTEDVKLSMTIDGEYFENIHKVGDVTTFK